MCHPITVPERGANCFGGSLIVQARAVDGMVVEQEQVVTAFVFSLFCLAISLMGTYGIMMTLPAALITSAMTLIGTCCVYHWGFNCPD
jgi:hypothetical protein